MIYLFTGQPGSGKTTLAKALIEDCTDTCLHLDGDELRHFFKNDDYSKEARTKDIEYVEYLFNIVGFIAHKGFTVVISMVCPFKAIRELLKHKYGAIEVFTHTDEIRGREQFFVEYYEKPTEKYIDIDTGLKSIDESLKLLNYNKKTT